MDLMGLIGDWLFNQAVGMTPDAMAKRFVTNPGEYPINLIGGAFPGKGGHDKRLHAYSSYLMGNKWGPGVSRGVGWLKEGPDVLSGEGWDATKDDLSANELGLLLRRQGSSAGGWTPRAEPSQSPAGGFDRPSGGFDVKDWMNLGKETGGSGSFWDSSDDILDPDSLEGLYNAKPTGMSFTRGGGRPDLGSLFPQVAKPGWSQQVHWDDRPYQGPHIQWGGEQKHFDMPKINSFSFPQWQPQGFVPGDFSMGDWFKGLDSMGGFGADAPAAWELPWGDGLAF